MTLVLKLIIIILAKYCMFFEVCMQDSLRYSHAHQLTLACQWLKFKHGCMCVKYEGEKR